MEPPNDTRPSSSRRGPLGSPPAPERVERRALAPRPGAPAVAYVASGWAAAAGAKRHEALALLDAGREVRVYVQADAGESAAALLRLPGDEGPAGALSEEDRDRARLALRVRSRPAGRFARCATALHTFVRRPWTVAGGFARLFAARRGSPFAIRDAMIAFARAAFSAADMPQEGVAHVHALGPGPPAAEAWWIARLTGLPYSVTLAGDELYAAPSALALALEGARFATVESEVDRRVLLQRTGGRGAERLRVVRIGVDPARFLPRSTTPDGLHAGSDAPLSILCAAPLVPGKGHSALLDALALLAARAVPFRCRFLGSGALESELRAHVEREGLVGRVEFLGACSGQDAAIRRARLLADADVVVRPSVRGARRRREGLPQVLVEGMACARPILASDLPGIAELVTNGVEGLLVPPGDANQLALALTRLWEDGDLRAQMGAAGRARVLSEYDLETNARLLVSLFDPSFGARPAHRPPRPRLVAS